MQFWLWYILSCLKKWPWYIKNVFWRAGIMLTAFSKDLDILLRNHLLVYQFPLRFFTLWKREYVSLLITSEAPAAFQAGVPSNWRFKRYRCFRADASATSDMTHHGWLLQQLRDASGVLGLILSRPVRNNQTVEMVPRGMKNDIFQRCLQTFIAQRICEASRQNCFLTQHRITSALS